MARGIKVDVLIVGQTFQNRNVISLLVGNLSITQIVLRIKRKIFVIELNDQSQKICPLYRCIIAGNHIIGTDLVYCSDEDKIKGNDIKYMGDVNMKMTVFDSDTFQSHSDQLTRIHKELEEETKRFGETLHKKEEEFEGRLRNASKPFEDIIKEKDSRIRELYSQQMVSMLKVEENFVNLIAQVIKEDFKSATGMTKEQIEVEARKMISKFGSQSVEPDSETDGIVKGHEDE